MNNNVFRLLEKLQQLTGQKIILKEINDNNIYSWISTEEGKTALRRILTENQTQLVDSFATALSTRNINALQSFFSLLEDEIFHEREHLDESHVCDCKNSCCTGELPIHAKR